MLKQLRPLVSQVWSQQLLVQLTRKKKTIALTVPNATVVTALVATFTNSEKSTVEVGEVAQESGVTENDFTNAVEYVVTAEDTTTATYTVTVTIATAE